MFAISQTTFAFCLEYVLIEYQGGFIVSATAHLILIARTKTMFLHFYFY